MFKIQKRVIYAIEAVIDIALNGGANPVQNISIAKRQGIPKRYLEQTLQILVRNKILVASRGPRGGYRLAKERRKNRILDIIKSVSNLFSAKWFRRWDPRREFLGESRWIALNYRTCVPIDETRELRP